MALDPKKLDKPLLKLHKLVQKMSKVPTQDEVHDVRTNTRRIEATLAALQLDRKRKGRRVLGAVTPMRKKAGDVRDMDVLTGFAATLSGDGDRQCLVKLLEHLGEERARSASRLRKTVANDRKAARKRLKSCSHVIEKNFNQQSAKQQRQWPVDATAEALHLSGELANWPKFSMQNLHPFRLKVKELRYVLQLAGEDNDLTERLGEVKDEIGEWHDWTELSAIAKEELSSCKRCRVLGQIEKTAKRKFETAVRSAQRLRTQYFDSRGGKQKAHRKTILKEGVLKASARLAA
jgi:CHAD domain-containing protein